MAAKLVISFDCEGKWGIADRGEARLSVITDTQLEYVYTKILTILNKYQCPATFGFVAAFCLHPEELVERVKYLDQNLIFNGSDWLAPVKTSLSNLEGWTAPQLIDKVIAEGVHHVCSHGGFHIPYSESLTDHHAILEDINLVKSLHQSKKLSLDALIFPRNIVGFLPELQAAGFSGYREIDVRERVGGQIGKIQRIVNEYLSLDAYDFIEHNYNKKQGLTSLSPAKFLNAGIGIRKWVSPMTTFKRIDKLLKVAVENSSIVHFYTHPHNFISDPSMFEKLDYLLKTAKFYADRNQMNIITMRDEISE